MMNQLRASQHAVEVKRKERTYIQDLNNKTQVEHSQLQHTRQNTVLFEATYLMFVLDNPIRPPWFSHSLLPEIQLVAKPDGIKT